MLRAHLIMNPEARGVTPSLQHLMATALEARFKLGVTETHARDAGVEVARRAAGSGAELLIAFGGDGLVNEVVNGMAGSDATLAIFPGGTMNVFARNLGIPTNPTEAADHILRIAGETEPRRMSLSLANDRYFTFACGCGFDAEAASRGGSVRAPSRSPNSTSSSSAATRRSPTTSTARRSSPPARFMSAPPPTRSASWCRPVPVLIAARSTDLDLVRPLARLLRSGGG